MHFQRGLANCEFRAKTFMTYKNKFNNDERFYFKEKKKTFDRSRTADLRRTTQKNVIFADDEKK